MPIFKRPEVANVNGLKKFWADEAGASAAFYGVLAALTGAVLIIAVATIRS